MSRGGWLGGLNFGQFPKNWNFYLKVILVGTLWILHVPKMPRSVYAVQYISSCQFWWTSNSTPMLKVQSLPRVSLKCWTQDQRNINRTKISNKFVWLSSELLLSYWIFLESWGRLNGGASFCIPHPKVPSVNHDGCRELQNLIFKMFFSVSNLLLNLKYGVSFANLFKIFYIVSEICASCPWCRLFLSNVWCITQKH